MMPQVTTDLPDHVIVTGADGCLGQAVLRALRPTGVRVTALVHARDDGDLARRAHQLRTHTEVDAAVLPLELTSQVVLPDARDACLVHAAAITRFKVARHDAQRVNVEGTRAVLAAARTAGVRRVVHLGSLYATGRGAGTVPEGPLPRPPGFANHYEESKWDAEQVLAAAGDTLEVSVLRPGTVLTEDATGTVRFANAVHHTLRLAHTGLLPLLPGLADTPLLLVTADGTAQAVLAAAGGPLTAFANISPDAAGSLRLGQLLAIAHQEFQTDSAYATARVMAPILTDQATFATFAASLMPLVEPQVAAVLRSLEPFAPQLSIARDVANHHGMRLAGSAQVVATEPIARRMCARVIRDGFPANRGPA